LNGYRNWKVTDYIDTTDFTIVSTNGAAEFVNNIYPGDSKLYSVLPVIVYGGTLVSNDTVMSNISLTDNMIISNGVNLIIDGTNIYSANDTITLQGSGFITGDGYFERGTNGWVNINSWNYSVFKGRQGNHPKIIWGTYPGSGTVTNYKVYRRVQLGSWSLWKTVSSTIREAIDSTFTISTNGGNNWKLDYKVTAIISGTGETGDSNTITYKANNPFFGKDQTGIESFTYELYDNYLNPFNPTTLIKYSIADATDVSLAVYDILGREIKILVNERKEPGNYEILFNADELSSGVYIYRMTTDKFTSVKEMILLR
jgi:hypothetical protein